MQRYKPFRVKTLLPLGLFITSATFSTIFGNISKEDFTQIIAYIKSIISSGDRPDFKPLLLNPKFIAPALFLCSAMFSVLNENDNQEKNQKMRDQMQRMDGLITRLERHLETMEKCRNA